VVVAESLSLAELDAGSNVLIRGPVMTGKRRLMHTLLAQSRPTEQGTIVVTTRTNAKRVVREFERAAGAVDSDHLSVVDCTGSMYGFGATHDSATVTHVSTPGDLTGLGIGVTKFMRRCYEAGDTARFGLHSLSTMLMYSDLRRVFQFLHVITGRLSSCNFAGVFALDDTVVDDRDATVLSQLFDAVVEIRETPDGTRELRTRGSDLGPRRWTPFEE
jgi:KaiC/GvpD/RAD55 family RecA-like ATPase